ncbi:hypothetical protein GCM10011344_26220 [Dokdonia pacifica]|uniref:Uncharacterized protein n=1 Tax=Dokdonia pacifica TaxID=1627892 RepID=A0A239E553_9FLAO|nr:hypothetical protein [Dokdonia pacifica]GGG24240.1 hypothetical protein GCM10011344_26220 [Dokdonia pacifica]SNS39123.1 hypothetical protein SAMN06265376_11377 [Dokdonia pacifica]
MKDKKNLKNLRLEKDTISSLEKNEVKGGGLAAADTYEVCTNPPENHSKILC